MAPGRKYIWPYPFILEEYLTEVIFKYVVVMKPTKLGMWFKLGF